MALDTTVGGASADSYGTLAAFQTYAGNVGWVLTSYTDAVQENNLRRATQYLDREMRWVGLKQTSTQALDWPRSVDGYDSDGYAISVDTIPAPIISAQFEVAFAMLGGADPYATQTTGTVARKKVKAGPVETETEYNGGSSLPRFPTLSGLLSDYVLGGAGGSMVRVERA